MKKGTHVWETTNKIMYGTPSKPDKTTHDSNKRSIVLKPKPVKMHLFQGV